MRYLFILILPLLLYNCTEEIIIPEKVYVHDTVTVEVPKEVLRIDTVKTTTIDTVYVDSLVYEIRDTIIYINDTIYVHTTDTVYITATEYRIDQAYQYYVDRFYREAKDYGWGDLPKNNLIVTAWLIEEMNNKPDWYVGDNISIAFKEKNVQWYIKLNEITRNERLFVPIYRELAHVLLNKPYAPLDANDMMSPNFSRTFTDRPYDEPYARPYLDKLFTHD